MPSKNFKYGKRKRPASTIANVRKRQTLDNASSSHCGGDLRDLYEDSSPPTVNTHSPRTAQFCADDEALTEEAEASGSSLSSSLMSATGACEQHSTDKNIRVEADIQGRRIVEIQHLLSSLQKVALHVPFQCTLADMDCISERRQGLRSSLTLVCRMCRRKDVIHTNTPPEVQTSSGCGDINTAAVYGTMSIGCGFSNLNELFASMDIPGMSSDTYAKIQDNVGDFINQAAWDEMKKAGAEEARLARECGEIDNDGVPTITVVADGAWSKRSYKNKYDASSGVVSAQIY